MTQYSYNYESEFSVEQLYQLVVDIEKYPEFLPWCSAARVLEETDHYIVADLIISFKAFTEHYRSQVDISPPKGGKASVEVSLISGPFKHLNNNWKFKSLKNGGTLIEFYIDFEFKSALLQKLIGLLFNRACQKMVDSFEARAKELFGK
jgi:coenzyme Q-binding protein COQ10